MKKSLLLPILAGVAFFGPSAAAQTYDFLNPMFFFGPNGDGSLRPGDRTYVTTGNFQRGMAYNSAVGNVVFLDRATGAASGSVSGGIYILDGFSSEQTGTLSTNGIAGGDFAHFAVGVSDDGAVYVGNVVNNGAASPFKLYRWDTAASDPLVVFSGDPGNGTPQRWGDTIDVRGAGVTTQILLGSRNSGTNVGTNVAILTTVDGVSFTATTLRTDIADSATGGGIAFGAGDTFWAKNTDLPLRQFTFDLGAGTATTLRSHGANVLAASRTLEALAVDAANNLLAIVEMNTGLDRVRLYDISNPTNPPALLDIKDFIVNNANATTTKGYLDFGFNTLYVHNINNGLLAFTIDSAPLTAPIIISQPASQRVLAGRTVTFEVLAHPADSYQWQRNGVNIPGATASVLIISNAQPANAGTYRVIAGNAGGAVFSSDAVLSVVRPEDLFHLSPLWTAAPGTASYVTSGGGAGTPNERSFAYNSLSNQLYVVQRGGNNYTVHVLDASTGTKLYNLKTNGILPVIVSEVAGANGIGLVAIDVADDGAIYACNASPNAGGGSNPFSTSKLFRVYRWANSDSNTLPVQIFEGDPAAQSGNLRWGDTLDARGSGLDTQVLLDNQNATARFVSILRPADESMNAFTSSVLSQDPTAPFGTSIGRTLEFGTTNTFWQKRRSAALLQSSFQLSPLNTTIVGTHTNFPAALGPVGLDVSRNILAGINFVTSTSVPDTLDLYDISDLETPLLLAQYNFPINHVANNNSIGRVLFAGNRVFALNGNNGMLAFTVVSGPVAPPAILRQPDNVRVVSGRSATLTVIAADIATYQWQLNGTDVPGATNAAYTISNAQMSDAGTYRVILSNDAGSTTSSNATLTVLPVEDFHRLAPLWGLAPLSRPYLRADTDAQGRTPLYRSIAYNPLSNHVYIVTRSNQSAGTAVNVLDAATGNDLHELDVTGISGGSIVLLSVAVGDDGAIYAANMDTSATLSAAVYRLYRWASAAPGIPPTMVFAAEPAALTTAVRWGDTMDVRGSGIGTEVLIDANTGTLAAILKPSDESMAAFVSNSFSQTYNSGSIGRSLEFGSGDTFWQKRKGARLQLSSYDLALQSSVALTNYENFPASLGPVAIDFSRNLVAGLNFAASTNSPDTIQLYDVSDFNNPLLIEEYPYPVNQRMNPNFVGQVLFAGNRVFALDGNNGILAFTILPPSGPPLTIVRSGSDVVLSWTAAATGFVLQKTTSLSPPDWQNVSQPPVVADGQNTVTESAAGGGAFYRLSGN